MKIAFTRASGRGETNLLLATLAETLAARGLRLAGSVQIDTERADHHLCDMDVRVLPDGPVIRISQTLGREARGCRLDPDALEQAVALTETALERGADLLLINKFGKHEADGRGFRNAMGMAADLGIPVLVGASGLNNPALVSFCGDALTEIAPDHDALLSWVLDATTSAGSGLNA
ncbi:MAG: 3-dehydroquinate dehydratase [Rhodobacterales bacterium]|nr:MAG: 3-dehydroquinate dehydratase [Rhodobacterales bacterium]